MQDQRVSQIFNPSREELEKAWQFGDTIHLFSNSFKYWITVRGRRHEPFPISVALQEKYKYTFRITKFH